MKDLAALNKFYERQVLKQLKELSISIQENGFTDDNKTLLRMFTDDLNKLNSSYTFIELTEK